MIIKVKAFNTFKKKFGLFTYFLLKLAPLSIAEKRIHTLEKLFSTFGCKNSLLYLIYILLKLYFFNLHIVS